MGIAKNKEPQKPGKAVKYLALTKDSPMFECPTCKRKLSKGIIYEYENSMYCSRRCFKTNEEG